MFEIVRYTIQRETEWNSFVAKAKNATFLFFRQYIDYHKARFLDHSLLIYRGKELYALLPANEDEHGVLWSHQGLTYGGLIMSERCKTSEVRDIFLILNDYLRLHNIKKVVYKHIPWVYCLFPSEEDLYAIKNICHAELESRDVGSVVCLNSPIKLSTLRRRGLKKAINANLIFEESNDFSTFWSLLENNLRERYQSAPIHSLSEILLLKDRFPHNIHLFIVRKADQVLGGTVLYISNKTVKTQYISSNEEGRAVGALDLLFSELLSRYSECGMCFFDFGTSNTPDSDDLNDKLIFQKEGFGANTICYDTYTWSL